MTREELRKIITEYQSYVYAVCYNLTRNREESENLTQDTFLSAFLHARPEDIRDWKPYLARIAANKAKDFLKSAYSKRVALKGDDSALDGKLPGESPEALLMSREGYSEMARRIYSLEEPYLKVSVLYFIEENSPDEIAQKLMRPKKTVQTQIRRARMILKNEKEAGT